MLAALAVGFMAAGGLSKDPDAVIQALMDRAAPLDERVRRVAPNVRRGLLCVALNVMMEARGEPEAGRLAVAWVTRTRGAERSLGPCDVVFEKLGAAQFSWTAYPIRRIVGAAVGSPMSFLDAQDIAWRVIIEDEADPTGGANHFWGHQAMPQPPAWARMAVPGNRRVIGGHTFIRIPYRRAPRAAWSQP